MSLDFATVSLLWNVVSTSYIIYLQFYKPKGLDTAEIKIDRLKDQRKFYSPLLSRVEREDYEEERSHPESILKQIINQENIEGNYKIMAEPELKALIDSMLNGDIRELNEWREAHEEFQNLVETDFKALEEKYESLMED